MNGTFVMFNDNGGGETAGLRDQNSAVENPNPAVGTARGRSTNVLRSVLPLNSLLTMNQASGRPKTRSTAATVRATPNDNSSADQTCVKTAAFENTKVWRLLQPVNRNDRTNRVGTRTKNTKKASTAPYHARTEEFLETKSRNVLRRLCRAF